MARTKRENLLILGVATAVGVFALDRYAITPYTEARDAIAADRAEAGKQLADANALFRRERELRKSWAAMQSAGPSESPSESERRMLHAMRQWAQDAGLRNLSLRPERTNKDFGFVKVTVHATGSGPVASVAKMLWAAESAEMPVRVDDVQLSPVKGEGADDVQATLTVSTLCAVGDGSDGERRGTDGRQLVASGGSQAGGRQ